MSHSQPAPVQFTDEPHDFHVIDPSPWPVAASASTLLLALGFLVFLHGETLGSFLSGMQSSFGLLCVAPGLIGLVVVAVFWWRDVLRESHTAFTSVVQIGLRYGMLLFILSEAFLFVSFFWAFFNAALMPMEEPYFALGGMWPPANITPIGPFGLPLLNTLILLLSSCTLTWSHQALTVDDRPNFVFGLTITVVLGLVFLILQIYEYGHLSFDFTDGIYPSVFFMATGFHGFHVLVGTGFLIVCLLRALSGSFRPTAHFGFEAASWYWHFVDVVWIFLFVCVYYWGG